MLRVLVALSLVVIILAVQTCDHYCSAILFLLPILLVQAGFGGASLRVRLVKVVMIVILGPESVHRQANHGAGEVIEHLH